MTSRAAVAPRAFAVSASTLTRWDPLSFHRIAWHWPAAIMSPIGSVLEARRERVDRAATTFDRLQPITIHFNGTIDRRKVDPSREYSMELWHARPGDIVVAKIDLKRGAVAIVPDDWENVVVTGHFAVYRPKGNVVPKYLHRVIQAPFFKEHLWRNKVGAEGRKEVKLDFFLGLDIPLPPLEQQRQIIRHWESARERVVEARNLAEKARREIDRNLYRVLDVKLVEQSRITKAFAATFPAVDRWSVSSNQAKLAAADLTKGRFIPVSLGSLLTLVQYGTSIKAGEDLTGTPVIRMKNIVDGLLDIRSLKYVSLSTLERAKLLLRPGDILFNRTNSKELVGKCAVFWEAGEYVFASYLIRLRVDPVQALPDYVSQVVNASIGRQQINALSRQIIGQANINSQELKSLLIPLPPLTLQEQVVSDARRGRDDIARYRKIAEQIAQQADADLEEMIKGTRKV